MALKSRSVSACVVNCTSLPSLGRSLVPTLPGIPRPLGSNLNYASGNPCRKAGAQKRRSLHSPAAARQTRQMPRADFAWGLLSEQWQVTRELPAIKDHQQQLLCVSCTSGVPENQRHSPPDLCFCSPSNSYISL